MATHLKIAFLTGLWLLILMKEFKPVLAKKGEHVKQRTKILETSMAELKDKIKVLEACQSCSVIEQLNDTINELRRKTSHLCNEPAPPENGNRIGSEFWEGKSVTYKCNVGFNLQGPTVRVCNGNGTWTGEEPTCEPEQPPATAGLEDSEILKKDASYLKALGDFLKSVVHSNSHWQRCWRASQDGWAATTFHSLCDNKGPTVTIIRVGNYIFGGYTSHSWTSDYHWWYDSAAFLFSLVNKPGLQPLKLNQPGELGRSTTSNSIYGIASYGPTFGGGHDIHIAGLASSNTKSYSNLGFNYGPPPGYNYGSSSAQSFLAGSRSFQPDEVEVFYETT